MFDCMQFYHYTKEKNDVFKAVDSPENYWLKKQGVKIPYCTMKQKTAS